MTENLRATFERETNVSRETMEMLDEYANLLKKWNPAINLVSKSTIDSLWDRHFYDSAQIYNFKPDFPCNWVDIGSGGGFPGLVMAIIANNSTENMYLTLVESDVRKATFLRTVIREIGLNATVIAKRVEEIASLNADILSARALAPLDKLLEFAELHLKKDGFAIFLKGQKYKAEIAESYVRWRYEFEETVSKTNPEGAILKIGGISRV